MSGKEDFCGNSPDTQDSRVPSSLDGTAGSASARVDLVALDVESLAADDEAE
jgi:hypothetical protein